MQELLHLPLEAYRQRYTEFLADWEREAFKSAFQVKSIVPQGPQSAVLDINEGSVLDSVARPDWCLQQIAQLIKLRKAYPQKVYLSDFFTHGIEALPYSKFKGQLYAFCWAQSFDIYDFTNGMMPWVRMFEFMAATIYHRIFVASPLLKELITVALGKDIGDKVVVVGLPFNSGQVSSKIDVKEVPGECFDVVYSSRWDVEKNPNFFLDLAELRDDLKFAVCTGNDFRGTDFYAIKRALELESKGKLTIFRNCSKGKYYAVLSATQVQFNCALQDWVSFTLLEALTYGCKPLYPNFRAFPETLHYAPESLYAPNDLGSVNSKLSYLLASPQTAFSRVNEVLSYHDGTLGRIAEIIAKD